jgi:uncharacterized protein (TIGR03067 family)
MPRFVLAIAVAALGLIAFHPISFAGDDGAKALEGVWIGQSMEVDGKAMPAEVAAKMTFKFQGNKLFITGNTKDGREDEGTFKADSKKSPKQIDVSPRKDDKTVAGIYEIKGDELKICLRHSSSAEGRPTEFATKADAKLILLVLKKKKA